MILGFSDGVLHKSFRKDTDRHKREYLNQYFFNAIEIHCVNEDVMDEIINDLDKNLYSKFKFISLHAPSFCGDNKKDLFLLEKIRKICNKFNIKNVIIHPDQISDWGILNNFRDLPLSIENMDRDKNSFKSLNDFKEIITKTNLKITLDLNHIYDNNINMEMAKDFHDKFADKIVEYHLSGYNKEDKHVPLFKTNQLEIIKALKFKNLPIIIESDVDNFNEMGGEYLFIKENLSIDF